MSFQVKVTAHNTKQLDRFMKGFKADIIRVNQRSATRVAMKAEAAAVKHIVNQDLGWPENSARYLAKKVKDGHSEKVLVKTSTYVQSITSTSEKGTAWAGVRKDARGPDGEDVASIAAVLEFGSLKQGIPPRPLWAVVLREVADWVKQENYFASEIIKELKRKYGQGAPGTAEEVIAPTVKAKTQPALETGARGGRYHVSASGRKVYHKR